MPRNAVVSVGYLWGGSGTRTCGILWGSSLLYRARPVTVMGLGEGPRGDARVVWLQCSVRPAGAAWPVLLHVVHEAGVGAAGAGAAGAGAVAPWSSSLTQPGVSR